MSFSAHGVARAGEAFAFEVQSFLTDAERAGADDAAKAEEKAKQAAIKAAEGAVAAVVKAGGFAKGMSLQVVASGQPGQALSISISRIQEG